MKKYLLWGATAFVMILSSCHSGEGGNPKEVLSQFFNALSKKDVTLAKKYATKDSEGMLNMMEMGMKMSGNMPNDHADKMFEMLQNVQMDDPVINGDKATINVKDKTSGENTDFVLKKEDGSWKVAFDMATLSEMANEKMKEHGMGNMDMDSMNQQMNGAMDSMNSKMPDMKDKLDHAQKMMDSARNMLDKMDKNAK